MEDQFEVRGDWWLPEREEHKVHGILRFSVDRGAELELFESLRDLSEVGERTEEDGVVKVEMTEQALELAGRYPRLLGEANGKPYTLIDCFATNWSWSIPGVRGSERIHVNRILRGKAFERGEALEATGVSLGLTYLSNWIMQSGIKEKWNFPNDGKPLAEGIPEFSLEAFAKPDQTVTTDDGRIIALKHRVGIDGDVLDRRSLTQSFHWRIDSSGDRVDLDDLLDWASDLQDLVSICTLKTAGFEFVRFWHPEAYHQVADDRIFPIEIDMFAQWNVKTDRSSTDSRRGELLFSFEDFGGIEGIRRWMNTVQQHRTGLGRVAATRYAKGMFISDRLLNCSAALEAMDRTRTGAKNSSFKTRLTRCSELAGASFSALVGDVPKWAETVRQDRDDVAHHFGRRTRSTSTQTFYLWESLYYLYVMCLFRLCDIPKKAFDKIQEHSAYSRLARELKSFI